ncbi:MAG TPA: Bcr/CflA family drug resistance efflux transporter [Alcaligenes faecalis]|nr:Bcr/CflA family drug resistance efflux transporter [Alcaligenes faecalis]
MSGATRSSGLGWALILLLALLTALDAMAIDMYLPGMPAIAQELGASPGRIQQTLSIFLAGLAIGQGFYGPLLDRYGRRLPLLIGVVIFVVGSIFGALATSVEALLLARFIQALGAAAGLVAPRAIVSDLCDMKESARIFSLLMQVMMIAPIVAPLLGSYLLIHADWRAIFWMLAVLGAMGMVWGLKAIPDSLPVTQRVPLNPGHILRAYGRELSSKVFMAYTGSGGFALASLFVYISGSAFVFTQHFGLTPAVFSYVFAGNSISLVMGGFVSNYLLRVGMPTARVLVLGLVIHTLSALLLYVAVQIGVASLPLYATLVAIAVGSLGMVFGNVTALTMNVAGPQAGTAAALMGTFHYLISALVGYVVSLASPGPQTLPLAIGGCGLIALLLYWAATRCRTGSRLVDQVA